jgi:DNA helicase HerA-like ATPase
MDEVIGRVASVAESQMTIVLESGSSRADCRIGDVLKARAGDHQIVGVITATQLNGSASATARVVVADLLGELIGNNGSTRFNAGVSRYPICGEPVFPANDIDVEKVYARASESTLQIGAHFHNHSRPAYVLFDELLANHFAILGATGSGKSCAVTIFLQQILSGHPNAHVILLDPHNEYSAAFGGIAEAVNVENLQLPLWLFDFEEISRILIRGGTRYEQESQALILKDAIARARRYHAGGSNAAWITVDTPMPFRPSDLIRLLYESMGKLDNPDTALPYLRIKSRLESLRDDPRFTFMFGDWHPDMLTKITSRLLRIPVQGKPLTIFDLSGVPSEITDVVVSLLCRLVFDFAVWANREQMPPLLLVCEEAQRYVPADERIGFDATARAITRIAKEGRKYGIALALVSQQPSQLSPQAVSQCGTVFAMRLGSDADQDFVARVLPDAARGMLSTLPSLPPRHAIVSGRGVAVPMRIVFAELPPERRPRSDAARFSTLWNSDTASESFCDEVVRNWRLQRRQA